MWSREEGLDIHKFFHSFFRKASLLQFTHKQGHQHLLLLFILKFSWWIMCQLMLTTPTENNIILAHWLQHGAAGAPPKYTQGVCVRKRPGPRHIDLGQPNTDDRRPRASSQRYRCSTTSPLSTYNIGSSGTLARWLRFAFFLLLILMCNTGWFNCHTERRAFILKCHKEKLNCIIMIFTIFLLIGAAAHIVCGWLKIQKIPFHKNKTTE